MNLEVIITKDGSATILNKELDATYHSRHGALQESQHIFIEAGLYFGVQKFGRELNILELGFGTGLNALLTAVEGVNRQLKINYTGIEKFPVTEDLFKSLNYGHTFLHEKMFKAQWEKEVEIVPEFILTKQKADIADPLLTKKFHVVYFDAFAPASKPGLWTKPVFDRIFSAMHDGACLTTFCAKGEFKRTLKAVGFTVESLPGPIGKREMVRALKV